MNLLPNKQQLLNVPFQSTKYRKKELCLVNKVRVTIEVCVVQHVEMKSVFTIQPIKRLVSTTVKNAKPASTIWIFVLMTKNRQLRCLAVTVHIVLQEKRVATTQNKAICIVEKIAPPITSKHIRTWTKKCSNESEYRINVSVSYWLMIWVTYSFLTSFFSVSIDSQPLLNLLSTYRKTWCLQFPTTESSGFSNLVPTLLLLH